MVIKELQEIADQTFGRNTKVKLMWKQKNTNHSQYAIVNKISGTICVFNITEENSIYDIVWVHNVTLMESFVEFKKIVEEKSC